jgi:hypothetical protein
MKEDHMRPLALMIGLLGVTILPYECNAQSWTNPFAEYFERGVTISPDGGDSLHANAAIHTIDPWPPYVGNTRITQSGRAAVNAVERMYVKCEPFPQVPSNISSLGTGSSVAGGGGAGTCDPGGPAWARSGGGGGGGGAIGGGGGGGYFNAGPAPAAPPN